MKTDHKAITLIELLVAITIVTMVIGGVFSADIALRRMSDTEATDAQLEMQTRALAETIRGDVKKVHGDKMDTGVFIDEDNKTICFRYDVKVGDPLQYTPADYADDRWSCYTQIGTKVYKCDLDHGDASSLCGESDVFVGTLVVDQFNDDQVRPPSFVQDYPIPGDYYFQMPLVNRLDPSAGSVVDGDGNLTQGTSDNPQVVMIVRESPMGF